MTYLIMKMSKLFMFSAEMSSSYNIYEIRGVIIYDNNIQ